MLVKMIVKVLLAMLVVIVINSSVSACSTDDCHTDVSACNSDDYYIIVSINTFKSAEEELAELRQKNKLELERLFAEGRQLMKEKSYGMALEKFLQANDISNVPTISFYIADAYYELGNNKKAIEFFDKTIESWPVDDSGHDRFYLSRSYAFKAFIYVELKSYRLALINCRNAIASSDKEHEDALRELQALLLKSVGK